MSQTIHSEPRTQLNLSLSLTPAQEQDILARIAEHILSNAQLRIDSDSLNTLLKPVSHDTAAQPTVRKTATQLRRAKWQRTYLKLKEQYPHQSDTWIAARIAKMDIADGRDVDTIRKNMKPKTLPHQIKIVGRTKNAQIAQPNPLM
jgi:hypothetical protein